MAESMLAFSKPENILIKSYSRCEIKVIDLGSSCFKNDRLSLYVQSRSYRAPEVILGLPYDQKVDLLSLGCILAELLSGDVLFPNDEIVFFLARVIGMIGPIDFDMLQRGQETSKYFTDEFDLYHINEETNELEYITPQETSLEERLQVSDTLGGKTGGSGWSYKARFLSNMNKSRTFTRNSCKKD
ncbi:hypothetical protein M8C21_020721 [Ambrosia artemisiifolia]|uniref:Protein kinase domain-containing protein n=1 Tax=Ambrosia artemisiifolia TaxID=4212 RepID=A0AAD5GEH2_AMBAR|nr:hypothetical protein M8C21_020721 [Ambrosia artemisiifolia]